MNNEGRALKERGMQLALSPDRLAEWKREFKRTVVELASAGDPFTSEDVVERIGLPTGEIALHANNAVGAMMNAMARKKIIKKTGYHWQSRRPASHGAEITVWEGA